MTGRAIFAGHKRGNDYAALLGKQYQAMPKALLAAIAVSFAIRLDGEENTERAIQLVLYEWQALYDAGIVTQPPPPMEPSK